MGLFKTEEEKAAAAAEEERVEAARQAQATADAVARAAEARARGPIGQAEAAKAAGLGFFEVQLDVGESQGTSWFGSTTATDTRTTRHLGILGEIEALGWRLENVGYVFLMTGQSSTDKVFFTGQETAVSGKTVGIYLFRNAGA